MKKLFLSIISITLTFASIVAQSGATFEFKISSSKGATGSIKTFYSSGNSRMEMQMTIPQMPNGGFSRTSITKSAKPSTVYALDDKSKTYSTSETPASASNATCDNCIVKVLGKEKVGNYNCTHATVTKGTEANEYWTTTEIPEFEMYSKANSGNKYMGTNGEYDALKKNGAAGFIVKSITKDARGGDFTLELVKMEKKDIPMSMFEIPADYKQSTSTAPMGAPAIDAAKLQNMTPEERQKYVEEMKKQYGVKDEGKK